MIKAKIRINVRVRVCYGCSGGSCTGGAIVRGDCPWYDHTLYFTELCTTTMWIVSSSCLAVAAWVDTELPTLSRLLKTALVFKTSVHRTGDIAPCTSVYWLFECKGNYCVTSNNMKLVHWLSVGGLLHLVQRWGTGRGRSPPINGQCINHRIVKVK